MSDREPPGRRRARAQRLRVRRRRAMVAVVAIVAVILAVVFVPRLFDAPETGGAAVAALPAGVAPTPAATIPVPQMAGDAVVGAVAPAGCSDAVTTALAAGDEPAVYAAFGGATAFREAVASGSAPCIDLADPDRSWVVVNKTRAFVPPEWEPEVISLPRDVRNTSGSGLRPDAAAALDELVAAAERAGAGEIALVSAYRSFRTQRSTYNAQAKDEGTAQADLSVARPGFSEHQSGLAADVVGCAGACGTLDEIAGTPQSDWIIAHGWEHGWIVRYESGYTPVTGYIPEPWHLRYIGPELARAYHDGGFRSLEDFFGLPAAPDYAS